MRTAAYNVDVAMRPPQAPEFAVQTLCSNLIGGDLNETFITYFNNFQIH